MFLSIKSLRKCILFDSRKFQKLFCLFTLLNCEITTLLKVERADTTVDKNNYHPKDLNSNLGTFHRFKPVAKTDFGTIIMKGSTKLLLRRNLIFLKKPSFKSKILDAIEFVYFFGCINDCQNPERLFLWL